MSFADNIPAPQPYAKAHSAAALAADADEIMSRLMVFTISRTEMPNMTRFYLPLARSAQGEDVRGLEIDMFENGFGERSREEFLAEFGQAEWQEWRRLFEAEREKGGPQAEQALALKLITENDLSYLTDHPPELAGWLVEEMHRVTDAQLELAFRHAAGKPVTEVQRDSLAAPAGQALPDFLIELGFARLGDIRQLTMALGGISEEQQAELPGANDHYEKYHALRHPATMEKAIRYHAQAIEKYKEALPPLQAISELYATNAVSEPEVHPDMATLKAGGKALLDMPADPACHKAMSYLGRELPRSLKQAEKNTLEMSMERARTLQEFIDGTARALSGFLPATGAARH